MVELVVIMFVLAIIFAAKAASIALMPDDAIWKSTSFSWMKPSAQDAVIPAKALEVAPKRESATVSVRAYSGRRPKAA